MLLIDLGLVILFPVFCLATGKLYGFTIYFLLFSCVF